MNWVLFKSILYFSLTILHQLLMQSSQSLMFTWDLVMPFKLVLLLQLTCVIDLIKEICNFNRSSRLNLKVQKVFWRFFGADHRLDGHLWKAFIRNAVMIGVIDINSITKKVNWTYIRRLKYVQGVFGMSYERSVSVLGPSGSFLWFPGQ